MARLALSASTFLLVLVAGALLAGAGSGCGTGVPDAHRNIPDQQPPPWGATPAVAMDGGGRGLVVWNLADALWARHFAPGSGWSSDEEVAALPNGSPPACAIHLPDSAMAAWKTEDQFVCATRDAASGAWSSTPVEISSAAARVVDPRLADTTWGTSSNLVAAWREVVSTPASERYFDHMGFFAARWVAGAGWEAARRLDVNPAPPLDPQNVYDAAVGIDGFGRPTAAWMRVDAEGTALVDAVFAARHDGTSWQAPIRLDYSAPSGYTGQPQVAADAAGNVVVVYLLGGVVRARRFDVGTTGWAPPVVLGMPGEASSVPRVVMNGAGHALALWTTAAKGPLYASRYGPGGTWSAATDIAVGVDGLVGSDDRYAAGLDGAGNARVLWQRGRTIYTADVAAGNSSWSFAEALGTGEEPSLAMDASGRAIGAWWDGELVTHVWEAAAPLALPILFASYRLDGNFEVFQMQADGTEVARLTTNTAADTDPAWAPTKDRYCFVSDRDVPPSASVGSDLYLTSLVPAAAGIRLTWFGADGGEARDPAWSPDGTRIAYSLGGTGGVDGIEVLHLATGIRQLLSSAAGARWPAWSPDGSAVVFSLGGNLLLLDPTLGATQTPTTLLARPEDDGQPAWSPDGTRVAFASEGGIHLLTVATASVTRLTDQADDRQPVWSPDGLRLAFVRIGGEGPRIWTMRADGGNQVEIPGQVAGNDNPDWR